MCCFHLHGQSESGKNVPGYTDSLQEKWQMWKGTEPNLATENGAQETATT
jgi:hypothetical protein